jgi:hypothetical protein
MYVGKKGYFALLSSMSLKNSSYFLWYPSPYEYGGLKCENMGSFEANLHETNSHLRPKKSISDVLLSKYVPNGWIGKPYQYGRQR